MSSDEQLGVCIEALRAIRDEDIGIAQTLEQARHHAGATLQTIFRQRRKEDTTNDQ